MMIDSIDQRQRTAARIAGISYLVALVTANFAEIYVLSKLIVSNDAARTAANIISVGDAGAQTERKAS